MSNICRSKKSNKTTIFEDTWPPRISTHRQLCQTQRADDTFVHGGTNARSIHQSHDSHEQEGCNNEGPYFSPEDGFLHLTSHFPPPPLYQVDSVVLIFVICYLLCSLITNVSTDGLQKRLMFQQNLCRKERYVKTAHVAVVKIHK